MSQLRTASLVFRWLLNWFFLRPPSSSLPSASSGASPASSSSAALARSPSSFSPSVSPEPQVGQAHTLQQSDASWIVRPLSYAAVPQQVRQHENQ